VPDAFHDFSDEHRQGKDENEAKRENQKCREGFADDAPFPVKESARRSRPIKTPAGGEEMDLVRVVGNGLRGAEGGGFPAVSGVIVAFHGQFVFGWVALPWFQRVFSRPGVGAQDAAGTRSEPRRGGSRRLSGAEELDMAELGG